MFCSMCKTGRMITVVTLVQHFLKNQRITEPVMGHFRRLFISNSLNMSTFTYMQ